MHRLLIVLICFIGSICIAQNEEKFVDSLVSKFTTSLVERDINSNVVAKRFCMGTIEMFQMPDGTMCSSKRTYFSSYVLWTEDSKPMIKKFDNCGMFYSIEQSSTAIIEFLNSNKNELLMTAVKKYAASRETNPTLSAEVHACGRDFIFNFDGEISTQNYQLFDLTNDSEFPNINYEYNQGLKVVALDSMLDAIIAQSDLKFRRQNY